MSKMSTLPPPRKTFCGRPCLSGVKYLSNARFLIIIRSAFSLALGIDDGDKTGICPPGNWDKEPKLFRKPEASSLIDLTLAMTVLFVYVTLTLHKSRIHCSGIMQC